MAFDMFAQLGSGRRHITISKPIHDPLMTFNTILPSRFIHALTKSLKKNTQQVTECDKRLQSASFEQ
jgi:hypothetical protein